MMMEILTELDQLTAQIKILSKLVISMKFRTRPHMDISMAILADNALL
jgi:hypothetical protein